MKIDVSKGVKIAVTEGTEIRLVRVPVQSDVTTMTGILDINKPDTEPCNQTT